MLTISPNQKLALLDLWSSETKKRISNLYRCQDNAEVLTELLPSATPLDTLCEDSEDATSFADKLWVELRNSPMNCHLYDCLLRFLALNKDDELHEVLSYVSEPDRRSHFGDVLHNYDKIVQHLDPMKAVEYLKTISLYQVFTEKFESSFKEIEDEALKKSIILRTIPLLGNHAIYDIYKCIYDQTEDGLKFIESIFPNFNRFYNHMCSERNISRSTINYWPVDCDIVKYLNVPGLSDSGPIKVNLEWEDFPQSRKMSHRLLETLQMTNETPLLLRDYQIELAEPAMKGSNCIVNAPTGSGKTIVAAQIVKSHLKSKNESGELAKVLFLIEQTTILQQQADQLRKYLGVRYEVAQASGADRSPLRELIASKDVIVCTAQLVVNLLRIPDEKDLIAVQKSPFGLQEFSLIIFDECHNTRKDSPYSVIMQNYHRVNFTKRLIPMGKKLPQIVGLTASLGVGKSTKDEKDALTHIIELCALMDCKMISLVRKHRTQLEQWSPRTEDEVRFCLSDGDSQRDNFTQQMCEFMGQIERLFFKLLDENTIHYSKNGRSSPDRSAPANGFSLPSDNKDSLEYLQWVCCLIGTVIPEAVIGGALKKQLTEFAEVLKVAYDGLELNEDFTSERALSYVEEEMMDKQRFISDTTSRIWKHYLPALKSQSSDRSALVDEVVKQLLLKRAQGSDFRAIVFIRTRRGAMILSDLLSSCGHLAADKELPEIKVEPLFGLNKSCGGDDERTNKRLQAEKLQRFKNGATRVLVATSVAEEGLDVANCNLVIKYNYVTNEIAHVQRRGRGRKEDSSCILITNSVRLRNQEEGNVMKERLMYKALKQIEDKTFNLERQVEKGISVLWESLQRADLAKEQLITAQKSRGILFEIGCKKCNVNLCTSSHVKTYVETQYCVCDPEFWNKVQTNELSEERQKKDYALAVLICKSCGHDLGRVVRIDNCNLPVLGASAIILKWLPRGASVPEIRTFKKWSQIKNNYFTPEPLRNVDKISMHRAASAPQFSGSGDKLGQLDGTLN